jgi:hypothetical protein
MMGIPNFSIVARSFHDFHVVVISTTITVASIVADYLVVFDDVLAVGYKFNSSNKARHIYI